MHPSWSGQHGHQHALHWRSVNLANPAGRDISLPKSIYQNRKNSHWSCLDYIPTPEPVTTARVTGRVSSQAQDNGAPASWLAAPVRPHGLGEGEASKDTGLPGWWMQHPLCASCGLLLIPAVNEAPAEMKGESRASESVDSNTWANFPGRRANKWHLSLKKVSEERQRAEKSQGVFKAPQCITAINLTSLNF